MVQRKLYHIFVFSMVHTSGGIVPAALLVLAGGDMLVVLESAGKGVGAGVAHFFGDVPDRVVGGPHQLLCPLHPQVGEVVQECLAHVVLEKRREVAGREVEVVCHTCEGEIHIGIVLLDVVQHPTGELGSRGLLVLLDVGADVVDHRGEKLLHLRDALGEEELLQRRLAVDVQHILILQPVCAGDDVQHPDAEGLRLIERRLFLTDFRIQGPVQQIQGTVLAAGGDVT